MILAAGAHARSGYDDGGAADGVDRLRFVGGPRHHEAREVERRGVARDEVAHLGVEVAGVVGEYLRDSVADGAVEVHGHGGHLLRPLQPVEVVEQFLRALDGEAGDDDVAPRADGLVQDVSELVLDGVLGFVESVPIGGFDEHPVGLFAGRGIVSQRNGLFHRPMSPEKRIVRSSAPLPTRTRIDVYPRM